ncbi:hypothetical protein MKY95_19135 [Paenibacillus sp. FSL P4-0176]|uniref:hypothetical protein n=1 Tax=Paenibacillus sp. FSL P4-0176 TaxID=2921631 RepID=UPI0030CEE7DB
MKETNIKIKDIDYKIICLSDSEFSKTLLNPRENTIFVNTINGKIKANTIEAHREFKKTNTYYSLFRLDSLDE